MCARCAPRSHKQCPHYQVYGAVIGGIVLLSFGIYPVVISCTSLLMRVCRTYDLEAKEYSEIIAAIVGSAFGLGMALSNSVGGHILDEVGFQKAYLIAGLSVLAIPFVLGLGFSPWAMGRRRPPPPSHPRIITIPYLFN